MRSKQTAMTLLTVAHWDESPPEAYADWFARGATREQCRSCGDVPTRGRYWEVEESGTERCEPMCPRCWLAISHAEVRLIGGAA